jgi:hypothetical protein
LRVERLSEAILNHLGVECIFAIMNSRARKGKERKQSFKGHGVNVGYGKKWRRIIDE